MTAATPTKQTRFRAPLLLPTGWVKVADMNNHGVKLAKVYAQYHQKTEITTLIIDSRIMADGKEWVHLSIAHPDKLPTYEELCAAKDWFIGKDKKAIQVFAPQSEHYNAHKYCLHLWACLDEDPLPDFRIAGGV